MNQSPPELVHLDTNLAILLVIGGARRDQVGQHKRLRAFTPDDFDILIEALRGTRISVCPNVLTEVSNLIGRHGPPIYTEFLVELIRSAAESFVPSVDACARFEFQRLGLADAVLLELARSGGTLLTADADLHWAAEAAGHRSVNFHHLRPL